MTLNEDDINNTYITYIELVQLIDKQNDYSLGIAGIGIIKT